MGKTLRISFSLKNTYRVNGILYSLKQIPLIKKLLPQTVYRVRGLKVFANVLSAIWEILTIFLWKALYFLFMVCGVGVLYQQGEPGGVFLHILLLLTLIGSYANTELFHPTRDKYYAMILLRMNAREYTLVNYGYSMLKIIIGFLPCTLFFGSKYGVPLWLCALLPFSVVGVKLMVAAYSLWEYEKRGFVYNENRLGKYLWLSMAILLAATYGLPFLGIIIPEGISAGIFLAFIPLGIVSIRKMLRFPYYREINQQLLSHMLNQMDTPSAGTVAKQMNEKKITADTSITSNRNGFEYLNELFIRRHQKILWRSTKRIALVSLCLIVVAVTAVGAIPELREGTNRYLLTSLPYFLFIMYAINRGTGFTNALFMNCDHGLLTYSFYKQPKFILKLFRIRLREIIKINLAPAGIIGMGLAALLYVSGGTDNPLDYVLLVVSILCMSIFFSVHYLVLYYLLQPYNAGTEMKSSFYQMIMSATYLICFFVMQLQIPIFLFGAAMIVFSVVYSVAACVLIYKFAPKTFKLRV